jgi:cytidine deaminase
MTNESTAESYENEFDTNEEWDYRVIHAEEGDLNPLKPCGACQEWLKKISECNPQFAVITFTDHLCRGIYVNQIADD